MEEKALAKVLESPKRFIEYLRNYPDSIVGYAKDCHRCPIAMWLAHEFPDAMNIAVYEHTVTVEHKFDDDGYLVWETIYPSEVENRWTEEVVRSVDEYEEDEPIYRDDLLKIIETLELNDKREV